MDLADRAVALVDAADLGGREETDRSGGRDDPWQGGQGLILALQLEQARFGRLQLLLQPTEPAGMGEVAGADHLDTLDPRPGGKAGKGAVLARCPGKGGMDMEVGDIFHGWGLYRVCGEKTRAMRKGRFCIAVEKIYAKIVTTRGIEAEGITRFKYLELLSVKSLS